jgi:hypothetical protein
VGRQLVDSLPISLRGQQLFNPYRQIADAYSSTPWRQPLSAPTALSMAGVTEMLPRPPLTRNQVDLMQIDTTASESWPGFHSLGISPRSLEDELEAILRQNKPRVP